MLAPTVTKRLIRAFTEQRHPSTTGDARRLLAELTDREHEVVLAVARGLSNR
ncbi:hypothetical protein ACBR40_04770 [Nonomuraea sp. AD125B]|uniref:hypothetical protein n=1 Tax=Nonomuraea sp. AD125B TaxID=3242897 RepID=UPI0035285C54